MLSTTISIWTRPPLETSLINAFVVCFYFYFCDKLSESASYIAISFPARFMSVQIKLLFAGCFTCLPDFCITCLPECCITCLPECCITCLPDCCITCLPDCCITCLPDCCFTCLPDCCITCLPDCCITCLPIL